MSEGRKLEFGPTAEDFHLAFGVGIPGQSINPVDGVGVALAAIQGLHALTESQAAELQSLRERIDAAERGGAAQPGGDAVTDES